MSILDTKLIIAEIGSVHDGSFGNACKLIELAASCGANAVKFQTHIASAETTLYAPNPSYFSSESRIDYFNRTSFSLEQWHQLKTISEKNNLLFLSSPFCIEAVDLLLDIGIDALKVASGEVSNLPLLEKIASTKIPTLISSGMSNWEELDDAYNILGGSCPIAFMQCTSEYPCTSDKVGLNVLDELKKRYNCPIGFSDHTLGLAAPIAAAALGATIIEKHFTFSIHMYGSDACHSMEPSDFRQLSSSLHEIWDILKMPVDKNDINKFRAMRETFQKSLVASCEVPAGTIIEYKHIAYKKPGTGMPTSCLESILGKTTKCDIDKDQQFHPGLFK